MSYHSMITRFSRDVDASLDRLRSYHGLAPVWAVVGSESRERDGERSERDETLAAVRALEERYGHLHDGDMQRLVAWLHGLRCGYEGRPVTQPSADASDGWSEGERVRLLYISRACAEAR